MEKRRIPVFASEAEEAKWWYDNREALADDMIDAMREGRTTEGSKARWARLQAEKQEAELATAKPLDPTHAS